MTNATSIPAGVGVAIQIDSEQLIVTAKAGNTLTVTRGANGTTAAAHSNGAVVNPAFDQRGAGFARKFGSAVDIGAFEVQTAPACPHAKGYWKNNPNLWPASALPMTLGTQTYTQTELLRILRTSVGSGRNADASLILADQLIAAKLNIANGSDPAPVTQHYDRCGRRAFPTGKLPYRVRPNTTNGRRMVSDAETLKVTITAR